MRLLLASLIVLLALATTAEARRARLPVAEFCPSSGPMDPCWGQPTAPAQRTNQRAALPRHAAMQPHPSGCPSRAFCGCGASVRVFGRPVRSLYLAANWLRFPRASPAPGMVAARRGHVFVLESHVGGSEWIVYDANSGGHGTRIHNRSIAGYSIVNPRA